MKDSYTNVDDVDVGPGTRSFVSPTGTRYFIESYDDTKPPATYHLAPRPTLQALFDGKCTGTLTRRALESGNRNGVKISSASFQAYKKRNEDRVFIHEFGEGLLFGVFDGHGGDALSEHASRTLPPLLASALLEALANVSGDHPDLESENSASDTSLHRVAAVEATLVTTFQQFDATLLKNVLDVISSKPSEEWTKEEAVKMMELHKDVVRKAITGTTALVGFLASNRRDLWVASLGDCEALVGKDIERKNQHFEALNELHNCKNPAELERIKNEHPDEKSLVSPQGRVLRALAVTRALGDMMFKVDPEISHRILKYSAPCFVSSQTISEWCTVHKTPPYISSTPSVRHYFVDAGDVFVLASDGLRDSLQAQVKDVTVSKQERAELFTVLAHVGEESPNLRNGLDQSFSHWQEKIGHGFLKDKEEQNVAKRVIENVLFGVDDRKMARELTMEFAQSTAMPHLQDDISVIVVNVVR
ncbi:protein serine/threonine phosphatase 2C [Dendrothele bispora CBS 962.96]|uniref:Protein serine/threonine phosphatase 2C n=1 Tax=Dendrothele bispora (strain CBS 962.96) TaxID=1314807 RepID=A0A4S8MF19_DENBC|nr:protein serine/threonine phosphatase 2C [Dendrothele bispora CBS 962.96]